MDVTISILPASLSLIHIPRSRLPHLFHPILRQILQPSPSFLNVTCNEIELSLFAEHHMIDDFEPIARRDRQRQRSRSGSSSRRKHSSSSSTDLIEISYEKWSVLQIDSHSDGIDNSGARVHELSAPLAAAGISILYQSSYMSDFIFVKETRLRETMDLLASAGFGLYSHDSNVLTSAVSAPLSPTSRSSDSGSQTDGPTSTSLRTPLVGLADGLSGQELPGDPLFESVAGPQSSPIPRNKSHSPTYGDVCVLSPDLTCVGLSDDNVDHWALKIVKLVAFPELIKLTEHPSSTTAAMDFCLDEMTSSRSQPPLSEPFSPISPNITRGRPSFSSSASSSSSSDDGYFSHSPAGNNSSSSLVTSAPSRSCTDLPKSAANVSPSYKPPSKHRITTLPPITPTPPATNDVSGTRLNVITHNSPPRTRQCASGATTVPFFSFTRTVEGSSLTTDVSLLAALFPPHERHMVSCSGELDVADNRDANAVELLDDDDDDDGDYGANSRFKCLQIDLRRFGLDKHGLVNRFSRVLKENGINHMYSSTFKTANLLVDKRQSIRAQSLLRSC